MKRPLLPPALALPLALPLAALLALGPPAHGDEGQWQPYQLAELKSELERIGIAVPVENLTDLGRHPMSAIVGLGGCSASFVSPEGLVLTNHHCAYGAIQRNSTAARNLIEEGFLARSLAEELPAGPDERIYVTESVTDVTTRVLEGLGERMRGKARHEMIERRIKNLIRACEADPAYRCAVPSFHRGLQYFLIKQLMIRDVRLVYAPPAMIGNYGGEEDNFQWPRHTGDFSFLRAYVGKDGRPADPAPGNVPYRPKDVLAISTDGLKAGDPILLVGYPGRTSRYKLPSEIRFARDVEYPARMASYERDLATIDAATRAEAERGVRYASVVKSIQNRLKKLRGLLDGFRRHDLVSIKQAQYGELTAWLERQPGRASYRQLLGELEQLIGRDQTLVREELGYDLGKSSDLLRAALTLHRLASERQKPDAEREPGFQERDVPFIKARLERLEKSFVAAVDAARWKSALAAYAKLPDAARSPGFDKVFPLAASPGPGGPGSQAGDWSARVDAMYQGTELDDTQKRLAWLGRKPADFAASRDPFLQLAVALQAHELALEGRRKDVDGEFERLVPRYMAATIAYKKSRSRPVYPDANGTLRVTYGTVAPYVPRDGVVYGPFTTAPGILEKHTGRDPFDAPARLREAIQARRFGAYVDPALGALPVNFLSSADTTGGNSGSAVLNRHGELVGLNFDSTYESITKDWYFDPANTRAIHVDIRYLLWVMQEVDHADRLLAEMSIRKPRTAASAPPATGEAVGRR